MKSACRSVLLLSLVLGAGLLVNAEAWAEGNLSARSGEVIALSNAGNYAEAIVLAQAMVAELETSQPNGRDFAGALNNLAQLYGNIGRDAEAEPLYKRAIAVMEKSGGLDSADVAPELTNLAALYQRQGRYDEAEPLFKRALSIREHALGAEHPDVLTSENNLAAFYQGRGRTADALPLVEKTLLSGCAQPRAALAVLFASSAKQLLPQDKALDQAPEVVQRANQSSAASAVNKLAVRLAAGSDRLAELVHKDQDLGAEADALDKAIVAAVSKPGAHDAPTSKRERLAAIAVERASLQQALAKEFPDYAALSNPLPLKVKDIKALLASDEAMVLFALAEKESYIVAVTRDRVDWKAVRLGAEALRQAMLAYLADTSSPRNAYPAIWGPFALIGESAAL